MQGEMRDACKMVVGKPEGKRQLGRCRRRRDNNSEMNLREIGWEGVDWIHVTQDREDMWGLLNVVTYLRVA
jgi:hypothetical protein